MVDKPHPVDYQPLLFSMLVVCESHFQGNFKLFNVLEVNVVNVFRQLHQAFFELGEALLVGEIDVHGNFILQLRDASFPIQSVNSDRADVVQEQETRVHFQLEAFEETGHLLFVDRFCLYLGDLSHLLCAQWKPEYSSRLSHVEELWQVPFEHVPVSVSDAVHVGHFHPRAKGHVQMVGVQHAQDLRGLVLQGPEGRHVRQVVHGVEAHPVAAGRQGVSLLAAQAQVLDAVHVPRREGGVAVDAQSRTLQLAVPAQRNLLRA